VPVDAVIHLDRLRCLEEWDERGHSEPYLWPVLLWVDDTMIGEGRFGATAPGKLLGAREVVSKGMKAGGSAELPAVQRTFSHRFDDGMILRAVGIVVAFFERDDTPDEAVVAAYEVYVSELPLAFADFVRTHLRGPETPEEKKTVMEAVQPKLEAAGIAAMSTWEKVHFWLGKMSTDDYFGFDQFFKRLEDPLPPDESFTLAVDQRFTSRGPFGRASEAENRYEVDGRLELREVSESGSCQEQIDAVNLARAEVGKLIQLVTDLRSEVRAELDAGKQEAMLARIRGLQSHDLRAAAAELEDAQRVLARCRAHAENSPLS
jgi:hypothetical protein